MAALVWTLENEQVSNKCPKAMSSSSCEDSDMAFDLVFQWS